jgi:hypothetical protein
MTPRRKHLVLAIVAMLPVALCVSLLVVWLNLVRFEAEALHAAHSELNPGMSVERVTQIMGREAGLRFEEPRNARALTSNEASRCAYTLVYMNPYYLDPAVYCYFDVDDKLVAADCFD